MTVVEAAVEKVQDVVGAGDSKPVRRFSLVLLDCHIIPGPCISREE